MCAGKSCRLPQLLSEGSESSINACFLYQITDGTLIQLSIHCPRLQILVSVCPSLKHIWFLFLHMQLTSDAATVFLQSLSHCELITDDGIRHLGSGPCAHDHLEVIELDNCPLITDASLEHLKSCHSLDRIELYDCQQITRAGIKRLRVSIVGLTAARKQQFGLRYWLVRLLYSSECDHSRHPSVPKIKPATPCIKNHIRCVAPTRTPDILHVCLHVRYYSVLSHWSTGGDRMQ